MSRTNLRRYYYRFVVTLFVPLILLCLLRYTHGDVGVEEKEEEEPRRRYAICFYGVTRGTSYITHPTIKRHIFDAINDAGDDYDVFVHTYSMDTYSNKRTKEDATAYTWGGEYEKLGPTK